MMGAGIIFNFSAILANGGYGPALAEVLRRAGLESGPKLYREPLGKHGSHD